MTDSNILDELRDYNRYIRALAEGVNPFTGEKLSSDSLLNDPQMIRFFYRLHIVMSKTAEYIEKPVSRKMQAQIRYVIGEEQIRKLETIEPYCYMANIADQINELCADQNNRRFPAKWISEWLLESGILEIRIDADGTKRKIVTGEGEKRGFKTEMRDYSGKTVAVTTLDPSAQRFVIENINAIISGTPLNNQKETESQSDTESKFETGSENEDVIF